MYDNVEASNPLDDVKVNDTPSTIETEINPGLDAVMMLVKTVSPVLIESVKTVAVPLDKVTVSRTKEFSSFV